MVAPRSARRPRRGAHAGLLAAYPPCVNMLTRVGERGIPRDHEHSGNSGQICRYVLAKTRLATPGFIENS